MRIDSEGRIVLGVKIGLDEKPGRDEMVGVDVKNEAGAWMVFVSWTGVVTGIFVGVTTLALVQEIFVVGAGNAIVGGDVVVESVAAQTGGRARTIACHS